jgi:pimeloyl-ACP methyl ester carboxylesterase
MSESAPAAPPTVAPSPAPGSGCPTPLAWQEVLDAFRAQRDEYVLDTSWGPVQWWEFGAGRPLVCLGGAAGDPELFALSAWLLREQVRCLFPVLPDAPGNVPRSKWIPGWSELIRHALQARGHQSAAWLGTGFGGVLVLQTACDAPELVTRAILQGCRLSRTWRWRERLLLACGQQTSRPMGRWPLWNRVVESNDRRWFPSFDPGRWEFLRQNLAATPTRRVAQRLASWEQPDFVDRVGSITGRVLIVRTEGEGRAATAGQEQLAAALPQAGVEWLHSAGQYPHVTHPHRLVKVLQTFLEESPS